MIVKGKRVRSRSVTFGIALILIVSMIMTGCGPANPGALGAGSDEEAGQPAGSAAGSGLDFNAGSGAGTGAVTFIDALGREVTVAKPAEAAGADAEGGAGQGPERVAALLGSYAQVWMLAGGEICATADDAWDEFGLELGPDVVNLGNTKELSLEKLLASEPEFIIASSNTRQNVEWRETLEATGIPTAYFEVNSFEDYLAMLKICTEITGRGDLYEENGLAIQDEIEAVKMRMEQWNGARAEAEEEPLKVLTMRASASIIKAKNSSDSVLGEALKDLGCVNIADSDETLLENLSLERILVEDPDYIFFVQRGDDEAGTKAYIETYFKENPAWLELTAVKEGRVYYMDKMLFGMKPNHRWGEAYEIVEGILTNE